MPPPTMLLPRRLLVGGVTVASKPISLNYYLLSVGLGCRRSSSSSSSSTRSRRFSSNAEQSTGSRRRWWSDEAQLDGDDDEGFEDFEDEGFSFGGSAREQVFDEPWFTKASRAYGYLLPVILVSILAATVPRAFLMAMAIPLAQSAVSLAVRAFSKTFGRRRDHREEDYDDGDDYYYSDYRSSGWESEDGEDSSSYSTKYRNSSSSSRGRQQQQPWAKDATSADSEPTAGSDDTDSASSGSGTGFGGWDELDGAGDDQYIRSSRRCAGAAPPPDTAGGGAASARSVGRSRPRPDTTRRRTRPRSTAAAAARYRQSPLFMRLLVAVFPFLGSWFRIML